MEHLRGAGLRRRQLERRLAALPRLLTQHIMPLLQYFAYIEITPRPASEPVAVVRNEEVAGAFPTLRHAAASSLTDIYPVFRELFKKKLHEPASRDPKRKPPASPSRPARNGPSRLIDRTTRDRRVATANSGSTPTRTRSR
jgi:hypothetical protein